ncbi:hypothetical protein [Haladaptatus sp. NG-SE-30]
MAAPYVAGAAVILMQKFGFPNDKARTQLTNTAIDLDLPPEELGAGLLNVVVAVGCELVMNWP